MQTASTTLMAAIQSQAQSPVQTVTVDFGRDGSYTGTDVITAYVNSISVDQSLTTDVPDGTRMVTGYSAATATVDLGGNPANNDEDGAWTWSPFNTDSPYYAKKRVGAPTQVKIGFETTAGVEVLSRHTGWVRSIDTDGQARTAEMQTVDGSTRLRSQILLPMATNLGHPGLDSRYFIDYILTQNGIVLADCDLEDSLNPLTATPYTSDKQDAWTLIQTIAAAEYATAFFDETGKFHYWNREHFTNQTVNYTAKTVTINGVTSAIPTVSTTRALQTLTTTEAVDTVMNHVTVAYQPLSVQPFDWVWQSTATRGLHSLQTISLLATFDNPVQSIGTTMQVIPIGGDTGTNSGYRACSSPDGHGDPIENLTFTITEFAQAARIDIHNPNKQPVYLVTPRADSLGHLYPSDSVGQPALMLRGRPVVDNPSYTSTTDGSTGAQAEALDQASINDYGELVYAVDGGGWIQDPDTAQTLASDLLSLLGRPAPYLGDVTVVADPRLQLGDRIELVDTTGTQLDSHAWVVGISDTFDSSGYSQSLTLRLCAGIGSMIWDHPTYGKWDTYNWDGIY